MTFAVFDQTRHAFLMYKLTQVSSINPFSTQMHSKLGFTGRPAGGISEYLLFTMIEGGDFGFRSLQNSAHLLWRNVKAYFLTNSLKYLKQLSKLTCQRMVTGVWILTLLLNV